MADILVTAELRHLPSGEWEASAYGGPDLMNPLDVVIRRETQEAAEVDFVTAWNDAAGSDHAPEEFAFVEQS